jgi:CBS domain-containing protein
MLMDKGWLMGLREGGRMKVKEVMSGEVATVGENETIANAAKKMADMNVGCLVVTEAGMVYGLITDRDITASCVGEAHDPRGCVVAQHMSSPVFTVKPDTDVLEAAQMMTLKRVKRLPVVDGVKMVGLVSISDLAKAMEQPMHNLLESIGMDAPKRPR